MADDDIHTLGDLEGRGLLDPCQLRGLLEFCAKAEARGASSAGPTIITALVSLAAEVTSGALGRWEFEDRKVSVLEQSGITIPELDATSVFDVHEFTEGFDRNVVSKFFIAIAAGPNLGSWNSLFIRGVVSVTDPLSGVEIYRVSKTDAYQGEMDAAKSAIATDLGAFSVVDFYAKYGARHDTFHGAATVAGTLTCDACDRIFARSELMRFNAASHTGLGWSVRCPACGDELAGGKRRERPPLSYSVIVPDREFLAQCSDSYLQHGWSVVSQLPYQTVLNKPNRKVVVQVAPQIM